MKVVAKFAMLTCISRLSAHSFIRVSISVTLRQYPILFGKSLCPSLIEFHPFFIPMSFCHSASSSGVADVGLSRFGSLRTGGIRDAAASFRQQNCGNFHSSLKLSFCNWKKRQSVVRNSKRMIRSPNVECSSQAGANEQSSSSPSSVLPDVKSTVVGQRIIFCPRCGGTTERRIPGGEHEFRVVCTVCSAVHYENPKMVVGCLVEHEDQILLCRRSIEPSYGYWTLPAGYMEIGESAAEGAARETWEEACAEVEVLGLFAHLDIPFIGQSYIIFRARLKKPHFAPGSESLECALFKLDEIPFDKLAFSSIGVALKLYVEDVKVGKIRVHHGVIDKRPGTSLSDPKGFVIRNHLCN